MTIKTTGTFADKTYSAIVCFLVRGFVTLLATFYIYSAAIIFHTCSGDWNSYCVGFLFVAPFLFPLIPEASRELHVFTVLSLAMIVTVLWTALALIRRHRSS